MTNGTAGITVASPMLTTSSAPNNATLAGVLLTVAYPADAPKVPLSVAAKRSYGIDGGRGARGNPRGDERHGHEQRRGQSNRERIDRLDAKEQAAEQPGKRNCGKAADQQAHDRHCRAFTQDH